MPIVIIIVKLSSLVGIDKYIRKKKVLMEFSIKMQLQIGDDLRTVDTAQLVNWNHQDLCSDSLH